MDSKVRHNSAEVDKYLHQAREDMDKMIQWEREEMDKKVTQERATVDQVIKQEREKMDQKLNHIYEETKRKMKLEREEMDKKVQQERVAMDQALQQDREKMEKQLKKIRNDMDKKLQQERDDIDRTVEFERVKNDCKNMQASADIDQKLQQECEDMDSKALLEQMHMEAKMMQDSATIDPKIQVHIPPPEPSVPYFLPVMDFIVHVDDGEISYDPKRYPGLRTGSTAITEPGKVDWGEMVENLSYHGYKGKADLYYLEPGCVPPEGLVLISGPEHVDKMLQAHKGMLRVDLYLFRNGQPLDDIYNGMDEQNEEPIESSEATDMDEEGSSPQTNQPSRNTRKRALTFSSGDEQ